tara:strand:- start:54 stop:701 length:648 start_codon:yes stop_codon:yes gene_type:complete
MGGTDVAENLVEVTVTQHAMYHFCNYQLWRNEEDKIAWRMLGGQISASEASIEAMKLGLKKAKKAQKKLYENEEYMKRYIEKCKNAYHNSPHKEKMINTVKKNQPKAVEAAKAPEAIQKKKETLKKIKHQQGEKNSQYGTMWITDGTKQGSYRIKKGDPIPEGFRPGVIFCNTYAKGKDCSLYGRIWINNGSKNKMIPKESVIPEGYKKGRLILK